MKKNKIMSLLLDLGIIDNDSIVPFYEKVRDRDDISVVKCKRSGVIFLNSSDHISITDYENKNSFSYWNSQSRKVALSASLEDNERRFEKFKYIINNKKWMDIGTGAGGVLDLFASIASNIVAVEPQKDVRKFLKNLGYEVYSSIKQVPDKDFEVISLFHVLEHLLDPIDMLINIKNRMKKGAKIIIEVPHAKDFLISFFDLEEFKSFTFWSEHLILHTRESLRVMLEHVGFSNIVIEGYQRYPLANHLHWLLKKKPGGHIAWGYLRDNRLDEAYGDLLCRLDYSDTLIAIAEV